MPASKGRGVFLMQWANIQWSTYPTNMDEWEHHTRSDWARKEIVGASIYREWVGEDDEIINIRGKLFPLYFYGRGFGTGLDTIETFDNYRLAGHVDQLVCGDGRPLGWFVVERLSRHHKFLGAGAIGQQVDFEAVFARVPIPDPVAYVSELLFGISGGA